MNKDNSPGSYHLILPVIEMSLGKFSKLNLVEIIVKINYSV